MSRAGRALSSSNSDSMVFRLKVRNRDVRKDFVDTCPTNRNQIEAVSRFQAYCIAGRV